MGMFKKDTGSGLPTSTTPPTNTTVGWLDTGVIPNVLKYYNTTTLQWEATGSSSSSPTASSVSITPVGGISATNTQNAIAELDIEKISKVVSATQDDIALINSDGTIKDSGLKISNITNVVTKESTYTVNGSVNIEQVVFLTDTNTVSVANANNTTHTNKVIGLALESKLNGELVKVQTDGVISLTTLTLIPSNIYYVGNAGTITNAPSSITGFIQKLGIAEDSTHLRLMIGNAIEL